MTGVNSQSRIDAANAKTAYYEVFNATPNGDKLFAVRSGVPLNGAFEQLSLLLSASQSAVEDVCTHVAEDREPKSQWAAVHLLEFTYALVQSMHEGFLEHARANDKPDNQAS